MLFTENYKNLPVLIETIACQSRRIFWDTVYSTQAVPMRQAEFTVGLWCGVRGRALMNTFTH